MCRARRRKWQPISARSASHCACIPRFGCPPSAAPSLPFGAGRPAPVGAGRRRCSQLRRYHKRWQQPARTACVVAVAEEEKEEEEKEEEEK